MKIYFKEHNLKTIEQIVAYQYFSPGFVCKKHPIYLSKCINRPNNALSLSNTKTFQINPFLSFNMFSHVA
jgi:hypothetical protein